MGCSVTKSRRPGAICSQIRTGPTASSSGLQYEGSSSHFLDRNPLDKEKGSVLGTSSGNSPDSARGREVSKVAQRVDENPTIFRQRPKDQENQDFSFKVNTDSSVEKEKERKLVTSGNQSLFRPMEVDLRKKDITTSGYFSNFASNDNENKTPEKENITNDIINPILGGISFACVKGNENQNTQTPKKSEIDQAGLAFSFMNLRQSNVNQPTLFFDEEAEKNAAERVGQYFNLARSSVFGVKPNETEKLTESQKKKTLLMSESSVSSISCSSPAKQNLKIFKDIKELVTQSSAQGSLSVIDPVEELAKEKSIPLSNTLVATSTNIATQRTVSSLANLCLDERKKTAFNRKFTTNLLTLVKPAGALAGTQMNVVKSLNTIQVPIAMSSLKLNSTKVQSTPNFDLKCNQLSLKKLRHEEDSGEKLKLKREQTEDTKAPNIPDRTIDLSGFEIPGDSNEPSPIAESSFPNLNKTNTPKTLLFSQGNTSFSRQVDGSTILDRTIYPLEDNITRMDLDRYSINVEMGERENLVGSPQKSPAGVQSRRLSNSFNLLCKAKSAILDTQVNSATTAIPQKRNLEHFYSRPKSFCEISCDRPKDNTSTGADCYLSPHRVPTHPRTPQHERSMTQDLNRTPPSFIETSRADKSVDKEGQKKINQYLLIKDLGKGGFGKVKLAIHCDTKEQYAVKISNKNRLKKKMLSRSKSAYTLLAKEVAIMKKMDHPNIVKLIEVIDDPNHNHLYIAMEFIKKGAVLSKAYWKHEMAKKQDASDDEDTSRFKHTKLTEEKAKKYFRDLILALDYLHNTVGIIHRDIKPENLLISADDTLKISDFGISEIMQGENDTLDTNAGTKLYLAPETWKGKSFRGKPADIWAAGGTLYYLLTGRPPFQGFAAEDIKKKILEDEVLFPANLEISEGAKNLIRACLIKDPEQRIALQDIMMDNWLTDDGRYPLENYPRDDLTLSEEDLRKALTKISFMAVVYVTATLKKAHRAKLNVRRKKTEASLIHESQKQS